MLRNFIEGQHFPEPTTTAEHAKRIMTAFNACGAFLRDPQRFPNPEINSVSALLWRQIDQGEIAIIIDSDRGVPGLTFVCYSRRTGQQATLIFPSDFVEQLQYGPAFQLGVIAHVASECRDYAMGIITRENAPEIAARAQAFEAETLVTLQRMGKQENLSLDCSREQFEYIKRFPQGLASLDPSLRYPTLQYVTRKNSRIN